MPTGGDERRPALRSLAPGRHPTAAIDLRSDPPPANVLGCPPPDLTFAGAAAPK